MSAEVNQSNSWGAPPVVVIDHNSQNVGSRRDTRPTIVAPAHGSENVQPIIIETFPTSNTPEPQTIIIAPPPAAAQGPPSPIYIRPGSHGPRFYTSSPGSYPSEYTPATLNPTFVSESNYGTVVNPPPPDYDSWSFVDDKFSSRRHRNHRPTNEKPSSTEPDPLEEYQSMRRQRRGGEVNRRRRRAESSAGRITFPRYGPPTTVIETNTEEEAMANHPHVPPPSPPPVIVVEPPRGPPVYNQTSNPSIYYNAPEDSIVSVILGSTAEEDTFGDRIGTGRIKRPVSWRQDYWPRGSALSYISRFTRRVLSSSILNDTPVMRPRTLAPCISYSRSSLISDKELGLGYDLRIDISRPTLRTISRTTTRPFIFDGSQLATEPPAEWMRLYHPSLPWYIDVERDSESERGITVRDVLTQMHRQLIIPVMESDVWNEDMTKEGRKLVAQGPRRRAGRAADGGFIFEGYGAVRLDFLGNEYIFEGLVARRSGIWEIKTRDWRS